MFKRFSAFIFPAILLNTSLSLAAPKDPNQADKFPPSPLEITTPDPLVRSSVNKQPLTLTEQLALKAALDNLNREAAATLQTGDKDTAFEIWNRELRLRRYLGTLAEVQALSRVGAIAWNQNDRQQLEYITQRLRAIQKQVLSPKVTAQKPVDLQVLQALGEAYQNVRSLPDALAIYNQILAIVRQQNDATAELATLTTIAELNLGWFDYPKAAATYEELLGLATAKGDITNELTYTQQLAYIYQQNKQPQQAIDKLNKLVQIYTSQANLTQVPQLKLAIAKNYESLARENPNFLRDAFNNYQEAYIIAWQSQQFVVAGEALQKLISLYRSQGQIDAALQASQILVETQAKASNYYGLMEAYDQMGKIYLEQKDYPQAVSAFQQGLQLAQQLKHEEDYFTQQIKKASGQ
ncbi:tetratricopeptide repeat protein [Nostoc sp. FACHB-152]|uniref:tetratricopeptide repeat protein n=1 Tax=unclassified Nostoc TaxID=2593658 RepID=UPI001688AAF5|nr:MULTISPECIES: tetratricopeptide repeat protein [unclassified Nostoc]MBD2447681.1 tetratricopeptide repeat protein [Nostoc sp. FACHB-152]MBD2466973.1 tetratricopeptide repeat protein [Nostoc sp. FACHB-145]